jgi:hypothetical protein
MVQKTDVINQQWKYGINQRTSGTVQRIGVSNRSKESYTGRRRDGMNLQTDYTWLLVSKTQGKRAQYDKAK